MRLAERITVYPLRCAMHFAVNVWTKRWGYVCFHPPTYVFGQWWPWYFYVSPNATPWASTFAVGPGVEAKDKASAPLRRRRHGHNSAHGDSLTRQRDGAWL